MITNQNINTNTRGIVSLVLVSFCFLTMLCAQDTSVTFVRTISPKFSIHIGSSIQQRPTFKILEGNYSLYSKHHISYSFGGGMKIALRGNLSLNTGFELLLIKHNFFGNISSEELMQSGIIRHPEAPPIVYYKGAYARLSIPLLFGFEFKKNNITNYEFAAGLKLNYSGFMQDEDIVMLVVDNNNQSTRVFRSNLTSNNQKKPWFCLAGKLKKNTNLTKGNLIAIGASWEYNNTPLIKSDFQITIPGKPVTLGKYQLNGLAFGLFIEYHFSRKNNVPKEEKITL